jgi:hypothetical protein
MWDLESFFHKKLTNNKNIIKREEPVVKQAVFAYADRMFQRDDALANKDNLIIIIVGWKE